MQEMEASLHAVACLAWMELGVLASYSRPRFYFFFKFFEFEFVVRWRGGVVNIDLSFPWL